MQIEIDQSGKFEDTQKDTVLAYANGRHKSILISSAVKRKCIEYFHTLGYTGKTFYLQLFVISLYFLLKDTINPNYRVFIDKEYIGKEAQIKQYLLQLFEKKKLYIYSDNIQFKLIGKKSQAHIIALSVFRKEITPDKIVLFPDYKAEFSHKKNRGPLKGTVKL